MLTAGSLGPCDFKVLINHELPCFTYIETFLNKLVIYAKI